MECLYCALAYSGVRMVDWSVGTPVVSLALGLNDCPDATWSLDLLTLLG